MTKLMFVVCVVQADKKLVNARDALFETPLHDAARSGNLNMIKLMLDVSEAGRQTDHHTHAHERERERERGQGILPHHVCVSSVCIGVVPTRMPGGARDETALEIATRKVRIRLRTDRQHPYIYVCVCVCGMLLCIRISPVRSICWRPERCRQWSLWRRKTAHHSKSRR